MRTDFYQTPRKALDEEEIYEKQPARTADRSRNFKIVESRYEHQEDEGENFNKIQRSSSPNQLDRIQEQIKECQNQLIEIHERLADPKRQYEELIELEKDRSKIKRRVVQLASQHKIISTRAAYESQRIQQQENERKANQEYQNRKRQIMETYQKLAEQRNKQYQEEREKARQIDQQSDRRKQLRIAEIEAELTSQILSLSRQARLNQELACLKYAYIYPDPYVAYPYLTSLAYPYSDPYWW